LNWTKVAAITCAVLLVGAICGLSWMGYKTQKTLHFTAGQQFYHEAELVAGALSYFFAERLGDMLDLVDCRELSDYFDNKALGMSLDYGLNANLTSISEKLQQTVDKKQYHEHRIYDRIAFLGPEMHLLADTGWQARPLPSDRDWTHYRLADMQRRAILVEHNSQSCQLIICMAYYYKGRYAGQILAWLSEELIEQHFLATGSAISRRNYGLIYPDGRSLIRGPDQDHFATNDFSTAWTGLNSSPMPLDDCLIDERTNAPAYVYVRIPVRATPFQFTMIAPKQEVYCRSMSDNLTLALGILALLVVGTTAVLWRFNARNMVLRTRLEETIKREYAIQEKNAQLEESRARLDLALKGGDLGAWDWNVCSGEISFSRCTAYLAAVDIGETKPHIKSWEKLIHPEDRPRVMEVLQAHLAGKRRFYQAEYRLRTKSSRWVWILDRGQVVERDHCGKPLRMAGTHLDVTSRKIAELELKKYQENLEQLVEERSAELRQTQKELVNKAIEAGRAQLSAMVLHNIGNAVTPINVVLDSMKADDGERIAYYLEKCHHEILQNAALFDADAAHDDRIKAVVDYSGQLIQGMKQRNLQRNADLSRISEAVDYIAEILTLQLNYSAAEQEIKTIVDLNSIVLDSIRMQSVALERRGIGIVKHLDSKAPKILIDKNRLMQLIINIIKNGYEAIEQNDGRGNRKVMTFHTFADDQLGRAGFTVEDTGIGVEAGQVDSLFEFGHSAKGSSGFGLYYCKMFVEANQGELEFKSAGRGRGASVTVKFDAVPNQDHEVHSRWNGDGK
jgi:signal transduction histidine kinase